MKREYLRLLQHRTAYLSIGKSSLRNQGAPGVIAVSREYLQNMELKKLAKISSEKSFKKYLDEHTNNLKKSFPQKANKNWGAARKAINLFLRDCLYNSYLCDKYKISDLEKLFEVPLDSYVAKEIYRLHSKEVPRWKSIKSLTPEISAKYQTAAAKTSTKEKVSRVHLDIKYWRNGNYTGK